jgi:hypothetical protein
MNEKHDPTGEIHNDPLGTATRAENAPTAHSLYERRGIGGREVSLAKHTSARNRGSSNESREIADDRLYLR